MFPNRKPLLRFVLCISSPQRGKCRFEHGNSELVEACQEACVVLHDGGGPVGEELPGASGIDGRVEQVAVGEKTETLAQAVEIVVAHLGEGEGRIPVELSGGRVKIREVVGSGANRDGVAVESQALLD